MIPRVRIRQKQRGTADRGESVVLADCCASVLCVEAARKPTMPEIKCRT